MEKSKTVALVGESVSRGLSRMNRQSAASRTLQRLRRR
jgi:hypothetical protein